MLSNDDVTFAVKNLQHVRGLEETGSLQDPDTVSLVDGKRCAVPDFGPADNARRKRRYATHGTVWNKTVRETHRYIVTGEILIIKQIQTLGKILQPLSALPYPAVEPLIIYSFVKKVCKQSERVKTAVKTMQNDTFTSFVCQTAENFNNN